MDSFITFIHLAHEMWASIYLPRPTVLRMGLYHIITKGLRVLFLKLPLYLSLHCQFLVHMRYLIQVCRLMSFYCKQNFREEVEPTGRFGSSECYHVNRFIMRPWRWPDGRVKETSKHKWLCSFWKWTDDNLVVTVDLPFQEGLSVSEALLKYSKTKKIL